MICPNCKKANDEQYVFCVNCGGSLTADHVPATVNTGRRETDDNGGRSVATVVSMRKPGDEIVPIPWDHPGSAAKKKSNTPKIFAIVAALLIIGAILAGGIIAFVFWPRATAETFPDHLGMLRQSAAKDKIDEIKKIDMSNALAGRDSLLKDDGLPAVESDPNLILYAEGRDIAVSDLHLVQLDSIKDDGTFKQLDFQATPIDGRPQMKRIHVNGGLAAGKYAFAIFDGFVNEGKHKFWPFQVRNSARQSNDPAAIHAANLAVKPTPSPTPSPSPKATPTPIAPPSGGTVAYTSTANLILRNGPTQDAPKVRNLKKGEKVYILKYSEQTEVFDGIESKFAYIQTETGQTGWVFAAYLK